MKKSATIASIGMAASMLVALTGGTSHAHDGCSSPGGSAITARSAMVHGRNVELRYRSSDRCAWGRIRSAQSGDTVWVNKYTPNEINLSHMGGHATVRYGSTSAWTPHAFSDADIQMTACGKAANRSEIACTDPF